MRYKFQDKEGLLARLEASRQSLDTELEEMQQAGDWPLRELNEKATQLSYTKRMIQLVEQSATEFEIDNACLVGELNELTDGRGELHSSENTDYIMDYSVAQHLLYLYLQEKE